MVARRRAALRLLDGRDLPRAACPCSIQPLRILHLITFPDSLPGAAPHPRCDGSGQWDNSGHLP